MNLVELLHEQAAEIAAEGHPGWGNTMLEAAREIESLQQLVARQSVEFDICPLCGGTGTYHIKGLTPPCPQCNGTGKRN
jgi:RecJ-like exonuclease